MNRNTRYLLLAAVTVVVLAAQASAFFCDPFGPASPSTSPAPCPFDGSGGTAAVDPFEPSDPSSSQAPCPFDGSGGTAAVDPFEPSDPSSSQAPCPFDGSGGTAAVDPFDPVDPATSVAPCPFPMGDSSSGEVSGAGTCGEGFPAPTDTDGDGTYEDLNGNGRTDFADVALYFKYMDWIREHQPVCCFDYNANGNIDFADLILLFHEI